MGLDRGQDKKPVRIVHEQRVFRHDLFDRDVGVTNLAPGYQQPGILQLQARDFLALAPPRLDAEALAQ